MGVTREEFGGWLTDPVTRWVFQAVHNAAEAERDEWERVSWGNGVANQRVLDQLRDRASALMELVENDFENWAEWNGESLEDE